MSKYSFTQSPISSHSKMVMVLHNTCHIHPFTHRSIQAAMQGAIWVSVSCSRTLPHAAQLSQGELGFKPATLQSLDIPLCPWATAAPWYLKVLVHRPKETGNSSWSTVTSNRMRLQVIMLLAVLVSGYRLSESERDDWSLPPGST